MDLSKEAQAYIERLVEPDGKPKILLLDDATTAILSLATTQSTLLKNDVFLIDKVSNQARQKMRHLGCIAFVRPSAESVAALVDELRAPKYGKYTLVFSNLVRKSQLERIAEADDHEAVERVQEMFLDWRKINNDVFTVGLETPVWAAPPKPGVGAAWDTMALETSVDSLFAALVSLRWTKPLISFDRNSSLSRRLATQLGQTLEQHASALPQQAKTSKPSHSRAGSTTGLGNGGVGGGADVRVASNPIVLVLDRLNDPITPLISHWTYQAMVDELLGIRNNRVDLHNAPDVPEAQREVVLAQDQDAFFRDAMFLNFGDLGAAVREYVQQYSTRSKSSQQLETVADIKRFVDGLPEFRRLQDNTTKHVSLVGELSRLVAEGQLLAVSEVEQNLACNENHTSDLTSIRDLLASPAIAPSLKYRLVALYGLRYRNHPHQATAGLLATLAAENPGTGASEQAVRNLLQFYSGGEDSTFPQEDLFNQGSIFMRAQQSLKGIRGVENVYTQHKALLDTILGQLARNRLSREKYPFTKRGLDGEPRHILIFIVGGATFEEARIVGEFNRSNPDYQVVLGTTNMVNPQRFLSSLE